MIPVKRIGWSLDDPRQGKVPLLVLIGVMLSAYLTWRPSFDIMFTISDALFVAGFLQLVRQQALPLQSFQSLTGAWLCGFVMLIGGLLVGSLFSADPTRWLIVSSQYLFAWVVLPMILFGRGADGTAAMLKASVGGVAIMNLFGALVYFTYTGTFLEARSLFGLDFLSGGRRLGAFTSDANWNGAVLSMAVPAALYLRSTRRVGTLLTLATLGVLFFGVMLTASFTAFTACLAAVVIFVTVGGVVPRPRVVLAGSVVVLALGTLLYARGVPLPETFMSRVGNAVGNADITEAGTFEGRLALIEEAWRLVEQHMLIGMGADQYRVISAFKAPVHNMYLLLWAEGGLISLFGWLIMMGVMIVTALMAYARDRLASALTLATGINFLIASTASPHMYARLWAVPMLLAISVSLDAIKAGAADRRPAGVSQPLRSWSPLAPALRRLKA